MNYHKIYENLIERAKDRVLDGYQEKHHIVPRCMGGSDDKCNLVGLTPEEHFLAHQLLVKMYPSNDRLIYACKYMTHHNSKNRVNNKMYGWLRRKFSISSSEKLKKEWQNEEIRNKHIESAKKYNKTEAAKIAKSILAKEAWKNASEERKSQIRELQKKNNAKVAERNRELWATPEFKEKMKAARSGILWWTDGEKDIKSKNCPGDNFVRGRSQKNLGRKPNGKK